MPPAEVPLPEAPSAPLEAPLGTSDGPTEGPSPEERRRSQPSSGRTPRGPVVSSRPTETRATGLVNVMAIPAARIYLRGRSLGETPLANIALPVGTHELEARPSEGDGPVRRQRVTVVEGETARVLFRD